MMIKVYVSRFNRETDEEPHLECYEIEKTPHMKVLDALQAINDKYDADKDYKRQLPIIRISAFPSNADDYYDATKFNSSVYYDVIFHTFSNRVGMISNLAIKLGRKQYNKATNEQENNSRTYNCEDCTILTGLEIDACKTGMHPYLKSILEEAKKLHNPYIMDFLPSIKRLRYISLKNFKKKENDLKVIL